MGRADLNGRIKKNNMENGKIMKYLDMVFQLMNKLGILAIFLIIRKKDMEQVFMKMSHMY